MEFYSSSKKTDNTIFVYCFSDKEKTNKIGYLNIKLSENLQKYFENDDNENIFIELSNKNKKHFHIEMIFIHKENRKIGVGKYLMNILLEVFKKQEKYKYISLVVTPLELNSFNSNIEEYEKDVQKLVKYYSNFGFKQLKNKEGFVAPIMILEKS